MGHCLRAAVLLLKCLLCNTVKIGFPHPLLFPSASSLLLQSALRLCEVFLVMSLCRQRYTVTTGRTLAMATPRTLLGPGTRTGAVPSRRPGSQTGVPI